MDEQALVSALDGIGGAAAPEPPKQPQNTRETLLPGEGQVAQNAAEAEAVAAKALGEPTQEELAAQAEAEAAKAAEDAAAPAFEVVVDGETRVVKGEDEIKNTLQKGLDYERKMQYTAAMRDALMAQQKSLQRSA